MTRHALTIGLLSSLVLAASPLVAQSADTDPMITMQPTLDVDNTKSFASRLKGAFRREDPSLSAAEISRAAVADFSVCHYDGLKPGARKVLEIGQGSELTKRVRAYVNGQCWLRGSFGFRPSNFQQALFATAYRNEYAKATPAFPETPINYEALVRQASPEQTARYLALIKLAECTARANPTGAQKLVAAPVASPTERDAFAEVMPGLGNCTDAGRALALNKEAIKGSLAEVMYRNAKAMDRGAR